MTHTVTVAGFQRIATTAGARAAAARGTPSWMETQHPTTGYWLQRGPTGYVHVHTSYGSWDSADNDITTLTRMWRGDSPS